MKWEQGQFYITDSKESINRTFIIKSLQSTYWGEGRPSQLIEKSIENSVFLSVFDREKQIGFARIVSDFACFAWLCDVYINPEYRGKGLGKFLMSCISDHPASKVRMNLLATKDAHGLYEQYGYERREMMFRKTEYEDL
jgi:GNAT superfamily N-acetyltransferase